ncbi:hypothetical protein A2783_01635 [Microgenomates group bacterium RIFCSPHIGHO2_01_FULL_45_11]|nr:MAG: hypothetical protein A2783_01635 [Microgenomates group bacterium RIFCSPHIGHO2_01_FULL_45_11]
MNLSVYCDGGARGNPGPAAAGVVVEKDGQTLIRFGKLIGHATNNVAEYQAVIAALNWLKTYFSSNSLPVRPQPIVFYLDSSLLVNQLIGNYKIKKPHLKALAAEIFKLLELLKLTAEFHHIPRSQNTQADSLVNEALDQKIT